VAKNIQKKNLGEEERPRMEKRGYADENIRKKVKREL